VAQQIGVLSARTIALLGLPLKPNTPILIGDRNIEHMKKEHPEDFDKYSMHIDGIIANPHYVAPHPDGSIQYIKEFDDRVLVAVRTTTRGKLFARTLFVMSDVKWDKYLNGGYINKY
jgi:hypothetical protein